MPSFPIWLPALLGTANLLIALCSLWMVRRSRRYFLLADASRIASQAALAEVLAITRAEDAEAVHEAGSIPGPR